jgi:hypothetical protein
MHIPDAFEQAPLDGGSRLRINFPYPGYDNIAPLEIPDANIIGVFSPVALDDVDEAAVFKMRFCHPFGAQRLGAAASDGIASKTN